MATQTVVVEKVQIRRSSTPGRRPATLDRGEEFVNFPDGIRLIGTGLPVAQLEEFPLRLTAENIGLIIGVDVQAFDSDLTAIAALATTAFGRSLLTLLDGAATRQAIGLGNADNTSDASKPVSIAQGMAIAARLAASSNLSDLSDKAAGLAALNGLDRRILLLPADPAPANIPAGTIRVTKNATTGRLSLWANDGGTMVDLLTLNPAS